MKPTDPRFFIPSRRSPARAPKKRKIRSASNKQYKFHAQTSCTEKMHQPSLHRPLRDSRTVALHSNPRNLLHGILIHECPLFRRIAPGLNSMPPAMPHQVQLWNHLPARLVVRNGKCSSFVPGLARIIGKHRPCGLDCSVAIPKIIPT